MWYWNQYIFVAWCSYTLPNLFWGEASSCVGWGAKVSKKRSVTHDTHTSLYSHYTSEERVRKWAGENSPAKATSHYSVPELLMKRLNWMTSPCTTWRWCTLLRMYFAFVSEMTAHMEAQGHYSSFHVMPSVLWTWNLPNLNLTKAFHGKSTKFCTHQMLLHTLVLFLCVLQNCNTNILQVAVWKGNSVSYFAMYLMCTVHFCKTILSQMPTNYRYEIYRSLWCLTTANVWSMSNFCWNYLCRITYSIFCA